ncbi:uncharacterized protein [Montipora capricornis]|uniref:uncharacterized protein n=1 Tax=Montipora capricornis TaxID=246305 RepID=UPI0035F161AD
MWKQFTVQGNTQYLDMLPKLVKQYNNTKHSRIKMTPVEASNKRNEGTVYFNLYGDTETLKQKPKFQTGDKVRISKYKRNVFDKGYTPNWTEEVFTVDKIQYTLPITYKLKDLIGEDIQGSFYQPELLKAIQDVFRIDRVIRRDYKKKQALVKWKGYSDEFNRVYPYDFMDSFDKFNEKLPSKEDFHSILNDQHITDDQYKHAQNVWNTFNLKNMGEYHDLYLKSDILLLADVFENFRKTCLQYYKLDPCHYFTSPGLSWDAMLKMTDIKLELMTDIDMFQFIEKGMRGGTSYITNQYGKANNKYMKTYDEKAPSKYIMYLDANNLYGWAMSQYLPTGGFKWMIKKQIDNIDLARYREDSTKGLILEVDLAYPKELHDLHNDYPLAPEKVKVDLSKTLMYDFHYNYIKQKYGSKAKLLFTDTDSLTYEIETSDVYQDFWNDKDKFDNSDYPQDSQYFNTRNKKVIGKFKDEAAGIPITEFVGLRSKMYSYVKDNDKGGKTAKGIKKNIIKNNITHENYKNVLFNNEQMHHTMKTIRSNLHQLGSYELNKVSLSCFDDKRYIHNNGMASYAYGHYKI